MTDFAVRSDVLEMFHHYLTVNLHCGRKDVLEKVILEEGQMFKGRCCSGKYGRNLARKLQSSTGPQGSFIYLLVREENSGLKGTCWALGRWMR